MKLKRWKSPITLCYWHTSSGTTTPSEALSSAYVFKSPCWWPSRGRSHRSGGLCLWSPMPLPFRSPLSLLISIVSPGALILYLEKRPNCSPSDLATGLGILKQKRWKGDEFATTLAWSSNPGPSCCSSESERKATLGDRRIPQAGANAPWSRFCKLSLTSLCKHSIFPFF